MRHPNEVPEDQLYDRTFWTAYLAHLCLVTCNALTFRYAEYISWMGESERTAGLIISIGMAAAVSCRLWLGRGIDRYGVRVLWLGSGMLLTLGCLSFLVVDTMSLWVWLGRIAFASGLAGMFTCSMVHIQNRAPAHRRTEMIGTLGSAGFVGMVLGSQLGDVYLTNITEPTMLFTALFGTATLLGVFYCVLVILLTRGDTVTTTDRGPSTLKLLLQYWPGSVMPVAMMMGANFTATTVFLTRYATEMGLKGVGTFFTTYAISAFTLRMVSRRWSERIGRSRLVLLGMTGMTLNLALLPLVSAEWHFMVPAMCAGFGHALLFPAVVSLGSGAFPQMYRGIGTTVVLGGVEIGQMIAAPIFGAWIDRFGFESCFLFGMTVALGVGLHYMLSVARHQTPEMIAADR